MPVKHFPLTTEYMKLACVKHVKYLGVNISENLGQKTQISLSSKAEKVFPKVKICIHSNQIDSTFNPPRACITKYRHCMELQSKFQIDKLQKVQRRRARSFLSRNKLSDELLLSYFSICKQPSVVSTKLALIYVLSIWCIFCLHFFELLCITKTYAVWHQKLVHCMRTLQGERSLRMISDHTLYEGF